MGLGTGSLKAAVARIETQLKTLTDSTLVTSTLTALDTGIKQGIERLATAIIGAENSINARLGEVHSRIDAVNTRLDAVQSNINALQHSTHTTADGEAIRRDIAALHTLISEWRSETRLARQTPEVHAPEPTRASAAARDEAAEPLHQQDAASATPPAGEPPAPLPPSGQQEQPGADGDQWKRHLDLLLDAAGIASATLECHRDLWAFFIEHAAREQHFRVPGEVEHVNAGKVHVTLSGRTLIAALTALWDLRRDSRGRDGRKGDWALSHELYEAIADVVGSTRNGPRGGGAGNVSITIDRRPGSVVTETSETDDEASDDEPPDDSASDPGDRPD